MNKRERIVAAKEGRKPSMLHDSDYLLGVYDETYDVNPIPYGDELSLNVDEEDNRIDIDLAIQTAVRFGIHESDAEKYAKEILEVIKKNWNLKYGTNIPIYKIKRDYGHGVQTCGCRGDEGGSGMDGSLELVDANYSI